MNKRVFFVVCKMEIRNIISSLANASGEDFFNIITKNLNQAIDADYTFLARLDGKRYVSKTISLVHRGKYLDNFEYSLSHTPCANVADDSICLYEKAVCQLFPKDQLLIDMKIEGYVGTPLKSSDGKVFGLIVALYENEVPNKDDVVSLFELFSGRISAEIERTEQSIALEQLNQELEEKVEQRSKELQISQQKLAEREKMAALGTLVAGVSHEINTPLGIALLSSSVMQESLAAIKEEIDNNKLSKSGLTSFIETQTDNQTQLKNSLDRTAKLINDFKKLATRQNDQSNEEVNLYRSVKDAMVGLGNEIDTCKLAIELDISNQLSLNCQPFDLINLSQQIIGNCCEHAFSNTNNNLLSISAHKVDNHIHWTFKDNGKGIDSEHQERVFEPFYTTNRGLGGAGLGMSIVFNIVTVQLKGTVALKSNQGTSIEIEIPTS